MHLTLRPEVESQVRERLSSGIDPNDLMQAALDAIADADHLRDLIEVGWKQADAGDFVECTPESIIQEARRSQ